MHGRAVLGDVGWVRRDGPQREPGPCGGPVSWVGVRFYRYPRPELYLAFTCDEHIEQLDVARPIDDSGRAEIERRRERHRRVVVDGHPFEPEPPLAAGAQARARLDEARRYAEGRPGWRASSRG